MADNALPISMFFHFLGLGLLMTTLVAGLILEFQFSKASTFDQKAVISKVLRPIGLLSPVAIALLLLSGIGNMTALGFGVITVGWLTAKLFFFALVVISGILFAVRTRKRAVLLQAMTAGKALPDAEAALKNHSQQIRLFYFVLPILFLIIIALSVYGVYRG